MNTPLISKSRFLDGLLCSKLLWTRYNARDLIPETGAATQAIFDQGHEVGQLARQLFPGGLEVAPEASSLQETLEATRQALKERKPLYEAAISAEGGYARADILNPVDEDAWDVYEVKSSTAVKDVNLQDLAFQVYIYRAAGLRIRRSHLVHVNSSYTRQGGIVPRELFTIRDLTDEVDRMDSTISTSLAVQQRVRNQSDCPEVAIGRHCNDPHTCPLKERCWSFLPEHNVFDLYRGGKKSWSLFEAGISRITDIGNAFSLSGNQAIQRAAIKTGRLQMNKDAIRAFMKRLAYPLCFLDFETFSTAIPLLDGTRPYQQIPFQFSLHIQEEPGGDLKHHGFLAEGTGDPRPEFMHRLRESLVDSGKIVVYNKCFESGVIRDCSDLLPGYSAWNKRIQGRFIDLLDPFRAFHYYHPDQRGSASIKAVLPTLTDGGYENLEIREGATASREFLRVNYGNVDAQERHRVRAALEEYCSLDTRAMARILEALSEKV